MKMTVVSAVIFLCVFSACFFYEILANLSHLWYHLEVMD